MSVAETAFYSFPMGSTTVEGATVSLARYMALAWGHVHFGINELRRDEDYGQSEIMSWAWDVQSGVRSSRIFILPHRAYAPKNGSKVARMVDLREIQFNNLSVGGRNVRETMFAVMPAWFREKAEALCRETLTQGELVAGKRVALPPLPLRIASMVDWYARKLSVDQRQLEAKVGKPADYWSVYDVVSLGNLGRSVTSGEITKAAAFPPAVRTGAEIIAAAPPPESTPDSLSPATMQDQIETVSPE
jgi:hypothetical protein